MKWRDPRARCNHREFYQTFKAELIPILSKPFKNTGEEGTLPYLFYEASITMVTKARQRYYKKTIDLYLLGTYKTKTPSKILANWAQKYIKMITHHNQVGFIPGMQRYFNTWKSISVIYHITKLQKKIRVNSECAWWYLGISLENKFCLKPDEYF